MQYKVINAGHLRNLEVLVNKNIADGWMPVGGVSSNRVSSFREPYHYLSDDAGGITTSVEAHETNTLWVQAMIRDDASN